MQGVHLQQEEATHDPVVFAEVVAVPRIEIFVLLQPHAGYVSRKGLRAGGLTIMHASGTGVLLAEKTKSVAGT